jgi:hypothetical protein
VGSLISDNGTGRLHEGTGCATLVTCEPVVLIQGTGRVADVIQFGVEGNRLFTPADDDGHSGERHNQYHFHGYDRTAFISLDRLGHDDILCWRTTARIE